MTITISDHIKNENFGKFHTCLVNCNGRYVNNPYQVMDEVFVHYSFDDTDDYKSFLIEYKRITTSITEKKFPWYKKLKNVLFSLRLSLKKLM